MYTSRQINTHSMEIRMRPTIRIICLVFVFYLVTHPPAHATIFLSCLYGSPPVPAYVLPYVSNPTVYSRYSDNGGIGSPLGTKWSFLTTRVYYPFWNPSASDDVVYTGAISFGHYLMSVPVSGLYTLDASADVYYSLLPDISEFTYFAEISCPMQAFGAVEPPSGPFAFGSAYSWLGGGSGIGGFHSQ